MVKDQTIISGSTKQIVIERQHGLSIGGQWLGKGVNFHHCISSGLGEKGVGYEWNVVALTPEEHRQYHDHSKYVGRYTWEEFNTLIFNHLKINYLNWNEEKCKVHKGWEIDDYGIIRK